MMTSFVEGALAGFGIAIPVGAIAVLIVDLGLRRGFRAAFMAGSGAATIDFLYASVAGLAGEVLASALTPFSTGLQLLSGVVLLGMAAYGLWRTWKPAAHESEASSVNHGYLRVYIQFLGLTAINPLTVVYFSALILGGEVGLVATIGDRVAFVIGAGLASFSWQTLLAGVGALAGKNLSPQFKRITRLIGNLMVLGFGLRILLN
jgi:arginine exporter protein ArgO